MDRRPARIASVCAALAGAAVVAGCGGGGGDGPSEPVGRVAPCARDVARVSTAPTTPLPPGRLSTLTGALADALGGTSTTDALRDLRALGVGAFDDPAAVNRVYDAANAATLRRAPAWTRTAEGRALRWVVPVAPLSDAVAVGGTTVVTNDRGRATTVSGLGPDGRGRWRMTLPATGRRGELRVLTAGGRLRLVLLSGVRERRDDPSVRADLRVLAVDPGTGRVTGCTEQVLDSTGVSGGLTSASAEPPAYGSALDAADGSVVLAVPVAGGRSVVTRLTPDGRRVAWSRRVPQPMIGAATGGGVVALARDENEDPADAAAVRAAPAMLVLDARDGRERWRVRPDAAPGLELRPPLVADGRVVAALAPPFQPRPPSAPMLRAWDATTGRVAWTGAPLPARDAFPAVVPGPDDTLLTTVAGGDGGQRLTATSASDGRRRFVRDVPSALDAPPVALGGGRVLLGGTEPVVLASSGRVARTGVGTWAGAFDAGVAGRSVVLTSGTPGVVLGFDRRAFAAAAGR